MADLTDIASQPKRAKTPLGEVENHSIREQIELDRYNSSKSTPLKSAFKMGRSLGVPSSPRG